MAPLSLKIVKDDGAITRKVKLDPDLKVWDANRIVKEKFHMPEDVKDYGLFLRSPDNELAGIWLEEQRTLSYYMLRNEDRLDYMSKIRNLRLRMLDGTVKTLQVDQSKAVSDLMIGICGRIGLTNHDEYGLCLDSEEETEEGKENKAGHSGTLTLKKKSQLKDRDLQFEQLAKKLKTDDNVEWIDSHKSLSESCVDPRRTLLLKRRLFYSDRNVDARDPVQLNLLYVQARDNILQATHVVGEDRAGRCKSRWLNMRDMMRRRIRNRIRHPDQIHHKYRYEEEISFLIPHYSNIDCDQNGMEDADPLDEGNCSDNNTNPKQELEEDVISEPNIVCTYFNEHSNDVTNNLEQSLLPELNATDPIDVFLLSVGCTLRKFTPYYLNQAKSKIFQIVQEYELEQIVNKNGQGTTVEFAGIQCQIHFGDFQEDKHKPGFLENLNEYLPAQFVNSWGIEKKILKEYRKHAGLSPLEAKYLYTKTARALPTYGVTFFLVKEKQKDKKKLIPRLLGINSEAILRLDEVTKEILQTWPLTHVKTYHAGKGETFTLNFGDYSDKEYSVKTRDAYRIRDILEGYIDLIRKRMLSAYSTQGADHGAMAEDDCFSSTASVMQQVENNPQKLIEHCMIGPSRIVPYEPGKEASQGTQIVTVQQIIRTSTSGNVQKAVSGEIPLREDMSMNLTRRLNRLNSRSVRVVSLLTGAAPREGEVAHLVQQMDEDLPLVIEGVKETIEKQSSDEEKRKLADQLRELEELMKSLGRHTHPDTFNVEEGVDAAKNVADVTTQMYFAMDPRSRRRSQLIQSSRKSFIEDERTESNLRRASFIAATATAMHTLDQAKQDLDEKYVGPRLSPEQVGGRERSAVARLAKVNGAIAHYLMAHSDPKNVDYSAAVTSMNAIHEYMPELVKDTVALGSARDEETRRDLLQFVKALCDATGAVCGTVGSEDPEKIHDATKKYSQLAGQLVFAFRRSKAHGEYEKRSNEIPKLSMEVLKEATKLGDITQQICHQDPAVKDAHDQLNTSANRMLDLAELTAPTIHEPHCRSSLTAGCEAVSSSAQLLVARSKPLLDEGKQDALHHQTLALAEALDRLKASYTEDDKQDLSPEELQRLKFITTVSASKKHLEDARRQLQMESPSGSVNDTSRALRRLANRLAQLNAAVAALLAATSGDQPDLATAEEAVATIGELMPQIVQDSQIAMANQNNSDRAAFMKKLGALCDATGALCDPDGRTQTLSEELAKYSAAAGGLGYVVGHHASPETEQQIIELAAEACGMTSELLCSVQQLEQTAGERGEELDERGAALADAAQNLLTQAQITAATISDDRCQATLLSGVERTSRLARRLAHSWAPLRRGAHHAARVTQLDRAVQELEQQLDKLRRACLRAEKERIREDSPELSPDEQRLRYLETNAIAKEHLRNAVDDIDKPLSAPAPGFDSATSERLLAHRLGLLSAAVAQLVQATRNVENPDNKKAEQSAKTISELVPQIVQDVKSSSANKDAANRASMLNHIRALCEATSSLCQHTDGTHPQELNDAISKYSEAADKLVFVITPHKKHDVGQQIVDLSSDSCTKTSELLLGVQQLSEQVSPDQGEDLDVKGAELADAAQALLQQAQLTSPSISEPQCRTALLSTIDNVSHAGKQLAHSWAPLSQDKQHKLQVQQLDKARKELEELLDKLRKTCRSAGDEKERLTEETPKLSSQEQRLKYIKSNATAKELLRNAVHDIDKPLSAPAPGFDPATSERQLAHRLGLLSAAVAQLVQATRNVENPDYQKADQSVKTISELVPQVVQDVKTSSANKDAANRAAMLNHIRALCEATSSLCQHTDGTHPQELNDAISKYSETADKLVFVITPHEKHDVGQQIVDLSSDSCTKTSELLLGVQQLSEQVSPDQGENLDVKGAELADAAQALLQQAQLTSSSISEPQCRTALLSTINNVSHAGKQLAHSWAPLSQDKQHKLQVQQLDKARKELEELLDKLRKTCRSAGDEKERLTEETPKLSSQEQRLKYIKSNATAKELLRNAVHDIDKPPSAPAPGFDPATSERLLAHRLGLLSAAVAQLVQANRNVENPDYQKAEQSVKTISELIPQVVQDVKSSSANKDAANRASMLNHIRALCEATSSLCQHTDGTHPQELNDAISKYSEASDKLVFVITPHKKHDVGQQIVDLSSDSCTKTSELLLGVQQLSEQVSPDQGEDLDVKGAELADAAQALLQQAQLTSPSISEPQCRTALLSTIDNVSHAGKQLAHSWAPLSQDKQHKLQVQQLDKARKELEELLDKLRKTCRSAGDAQSTSVQSIPPPKPGRPAKPEKPVKPVKSVKPEVPKRVSSYHQVYKTSDLTKEFLNRIRDEESQAQAAAVLDRERQWNKEMEQKQQQQFLATVEDMSKQILTTEESLLKWSKSSEFSSSSAMSANECLRLQEKMQHQLALAGVEVANVVAANYADKIDYPRASQSTSALPKLVADIVEDGKLLSSTVKKESRAALLGDMLLLCRAGRDICEAAKTDRKKLNDAAMEFGDKSAKLVYVVGTDADPKVEKEIISRAKAIGDAASRLAVTASQQTVGTGAKPVGTGAKPLGIGAQAGGTGAKPVGTGAQALGTGAKPVDTGAQTGTTVGTGAPSAALCAAGTKALNDAGILIYTAKLVSPSIHEPRCQQALVSAAESLSQTLADFSACCLHEDPDQLRHLKDEADNLDRIVSTLASDVGRGGAGRARDGERLLIEDTPLRLLTVDILEDVKKLSQASDLPMSSRQEYAAYADRLSGALRALDLATARCRRNPNDISKRSELEHAVQSLQMALLTSRPHAEDRHSNIVDLRDFIDEVSSQAQKMAEATAEFKLEGQDKKALQNVESRCSGLGSEAYKLTHPDGETGYDTTFVDILHVDNFGQDCDDLIRQIESDLKTIEDTKAKRKLLEKLIHLNESCHVLRFATKSGISSTKSAGLFSTLEDLDDIEARLIKALLKDKGDQAHVTLRSPAAADSGRLSPVTSLMSAARDVTVTSPRAPLTAYIAHTAAAVASDEDKNNLLKHLYKLVALFRLKALTTSKRIATWQNLDHPEVATITDQILQEIQTPESGVKVRGAASGVLGPSDTSRLLLPGEPNVLPNRKEQDAELSKLCTKLSSMTSGVKQSVVSQESLARSAREAARTAQALAAVARGCKDHRNPTQSNQIEEDVQQMTFATYNLLKVAEQSIKDPNSHNTRRRLQDACRNLNNAISKLVISSSSTPEVPRTCLSLTLSLQSISPTAGPYSPPNLWLDKSRDPSTDLSADLSEELSVPSAHTLSYENATDALQKQQNVMNKMNNDQRRCRLEVTKELRDVTTAVRKSSEYATQCAYLMSISETNKEVAMAGVADVPRIERGIERLQDTCMALIGAADVQRAKEESADLSQRISDLSLALEEASMMAHAEGRSTLAQVRGDVASQGEAVQRALKEGKDMDKVVTQSALLLEQLTAAYCRVERCPLLPRAPQHMAPENKARCDDLVDHSKSLIDKTLALVKDVESHEQTETMTWTTFSTSRKKLLEAYDALLKAVRVNGQRAGILQAVEEDKEDTEAQQKTYLDTQVALAHKWLYRPMCKDSVRVAGNQAVHNVLGVARQMADMAEDGAGQDREEMRQLLLEVEQLQLQCSTSRDIDRYRMLAERIKDLKKCIQRGLVTRVVEDLIDVDNPMEDLELLADAERDPTKRKLILKKKIAELLSQLARVSRTARVVAAGAGAGAEAEAGNGDTELLKSTKQTELLAPMLVQAAENRINNPDDAEAIEKYGALVLEYAACIARVRGLCDQAVEPMAFVQAAGDTMQRLREDAAGADPRRCAYASQAIIRLANRAIEVSLSSSGSQSDPEMQAALVTAKAKLNAAAPSGTRASKLPDIQASTAEIIKATNEMESCLGGENIFNKQPVESNQQIFDVARTLHESVREWSSRDNEVVAAARRMAVLMARLSEYMHTDNKQALIATSKKIVLESQEVAELAKKLAHECTDVRIKTNLLQTCERIPTISGQLKMLTTVKASSLGQQGSEEDIAAMDMLVTNAQSLMLSVQEVVKAAAGASVKIQSQRGPRLRWVRKQLY